MILDVPLRCCEATALTQAQGVSLCLIRDESFPDGFSLHQLHLPYASQGPAREICPCGNCSMPLLEGTGSNGAY